MEHVLKNYRKATDPCGTHSLGAVSKCLEKSQHQPDTVSSSKETHSVCFMKLILS